MAVSNVGTGPLEEPRPADWQPYDATAGGDMAGWRKLPGGPCDMSTGQLTGEDFPDSGPWRQC